MSYQALCGKCVSTLAVSVHGASIAVDVGGFRATVHWWRLFSVSYILRYLACMCMQLQLVCTNPRRQREHAHSHI